MQRVWWHSSPGIAIILDVLNYANLHVNNLQWGISWKLGTPILKSIVKKLGEHLFILLLYSMQTQ